MLTGVATIILYVQSHCTELCNGVPHLRVPHGTVLQYVARQNLHFSDALQCYLHGGNGAGGIKPITPERNNQREVQVSLCCCLVPREQQSE